MESHQWWDDKYVHVWLEQKGFYKKKAQNTKSPTCIGATSIPPVRVSSDATPKKFQSTVSDRHNDSLYLGNFGNFCSDVRRGVFHQRRVQLFIQSFLTKVNHVKNDGTVEWAGFCIRCWCRSRNGRTCIVCCKRTAARLATGKLRLRTSFPVTTLLAGIALWPRVLLADVNTYSIMEAFSSGRFEWMIELNKVLA